MQADLRAMFEAEKAKGHAPNVARGLHLKNRDGSFQVSSIEMEYQAWASGYRAGASSAQVAPPGAQEAVGTVVGMPGSGGGFTMCAFNATDVPVGTKLYTAPVPATAPAEQPEGEANPDNQGK